MTYTCPVCGRSFGPFAGEGEMAQFAGRHIDECRNPERCNLPVNASLAPCGYRRPCPIHGPIIQSLIDSAPPISDMAFRVKHAIEQIDHALTYSRIDGAAAAWLRTIKSGLDGSEETAR